MTELILLIPTGFPLRLAIWNRDVVAFNNEYDSYVYDNIDAVYVAAFGSKYMLDKLLLKSATANQYVSPEGYTLLDWAVYYRNNSLIQSYIAQVMLATHDGKTCIHYAAISNNYIALSAIITSNPSIKTSIDTYGRSW